jgi:hypothetical protein
MNNASNGSAHHWNSMVVDDVWVCRTECTRLIGDIGVFKNCHAMINYHTVKNHKAYVENVTEKQPSSQ